jgi:ABC-type multidrug transport system ATPase subunit
MTIAIRAEGLRKVYPGRGAALDGVDLEVREGETLGVVGVNGAGKTTLMGCLLGLILPDEGRMTIAGRLPHDLFIKSQIGYMPERPAYEQWMTGKQFLEYQHGLSGLPRDARANDVAAVLERVQLDGEAATRRVATYSKGMLQRLGLGQALLGAPRFLFLDEPTSGVDPAGLSRFREVFGELRAAGCTITMNSHNLQEVERSCDRVVFFNRGKVEAVDTMVGGRLARVVKLSWIAAKTPPAITRQALEELAQAAGAVLVSSTADQGRFQVADDDMAAALLSKLVTAGLPVVEAVPEENRVERLMAARLEGSPR